MPTRTAKADWQGDFKRGGGSVSTETGVLDSPYNFSGRFESGSGTNPEELLAASHASCFATALNGTLGRRNGSVARTVITATITADMGETGITLKSSRLKIEAEGLQGMDEAGFREAVQVADKGCPISNALRAALSIEHDITVK